METSFTPLLHTKFFHRCYNRWKKRYGKEVSVLGDSHARVFHHPTLTYAFPRHYFNIVMVTGATVSGLENPNSKSGAGTTYMAHAKNASADTTIVLLGEVDTGFVIWYRAEKYGSSVEEMLALALGNYRRLLKTLSERSNVICISAPLPTIPDESIIGDVANARMKIRATQHQRTQLTLEFNWKMRNFCQMHDFTHIGLDATSLGNDGLVSPRLLNPNPADHHYATPVYAQMLVDSLKRVLPG